MIAGGCRKASAGFRDMVIFGAFIIMRHAMAGNPILKTIAYVQRNGIKPAFYAALERLHDEKEEYIYEAPSIDELIRQKSESYAWGESAPLISVVVPVFRTPENYFTKMVESVLSQTYSRFELVLADAGEKDFFSQKIKHLIGSDERIKYIHLDINDGISANTNEGIKAAKGDYIAFLDHDDFLAPNALYEVARVVRNAQSIRQMPYLIYSDEDKCDADGMNFFEPNIKPDFNLDYLLSNNYISHFSAVNAAALKETGLLRKNFDGAQDYDLILRVVSAALINGGGIYHIPKALYHWRCHESSTAANPKSKSYAYLAGKRAIASFLLDNGIKADVSELPHVGFYRCEYDDDYFDYLSSEIVNKNTAKVRRLGAVGGKLIDKRGRIVSGMYDSNGQVVFENLPKGYGGGLMHRAVLEQDAYAVDIRLIRVNKDLWPQFKSVTGFDYNENSDKQRQNINELITNKCPSNLSEADFAAKLSMEFCTLVRNMGYLIMWDPYLIAVLGSDGKTGSANDH